MSKASFFTCLVLLSVVAIASSQTPTRKLPLTEPLEKYEDPPAPIFRIETSPRMVSQYGPFTSYQANVDAQGHNIVGDAANEPSISVDPTNGNKMAITWRQFNSVSSNFRQAGYGYTTDGGTSWTFPGVLENNVFRSDPVSNSDETGKFFYLSLRSDQAQSFFCDDIWRSLTGGQSWTEQGPAHGGDKEWFTIDKTNSMGHGFQYQFWTGFFSCDGGEFSRSTDGGVTWMTPINIPNNVQTGTLDVDTNGNLFIGGTGGQFWCIRSSNAQNGGVTPTFDQVTAVNLGGSLVQGGINGVGLCGQTFLMIDRSGTATTNNIYMLASVQPTGASNGTDVMFARSTNGGQTFSTPKRINDDPINHNKWHWLGTLSVAPNGRIDSVWLDTRNAANNTDSQLFYSYSTDGGDTWSPNVAVSIAFNPFLGYPNQNKIGDYITIVSDNTGGDVAYAATFNLEEDVYYVRVFPGGVAPTPTPSPTSTPTATATASPTPAITPCAEASVFGENFDGVTAPALPAGWSASNAAGAAPLWVTSTTMPSTPPNAAFIDDPATVSDKRLDTPDIAINGQGAQVFFRNFYNLQSSSTPGVGFDGGVLEVSSPNINAGAFTDITNAAVGGSFINGGYNRAISTMFMSPIAGRMAWSGNSGGYINTVANLGPSVVGHFIKLRFRMASDNNVSSTGWRIDNVSVTVLCQTPSPTPTASCPPITQSSTQTITKANSTSCNNGVGHTDNSYWRAFNMATFVGGQSYNVTSVSFGVESANNTQPVTVRLYTNSGGAFPGGARTQIATSTINVMSAESGTVVTTPLMATVPAGTSELVMELFTPNGEASGNLFFVGSNVDPQSGPSYLSAADCGVTVPTDTAALGFPNMHIVFNVNGTCGAGTPTPTPTPPSSPTPTSTPSPSVTPAAQPLNLSTRMRVQTDANVGIGGFIITGSAPKQLLLRGIGPSLAGAGVPDSLADPVMELHGPAGFTTIINDNWKDTQQAAIQATGLAPTNDLESAILVTLDSGAYTAIVKGKNNTSGVGLVEAYALDQAAASKLANISTRAFVSTGANIMIAGLILGNGSGNDNVILRGIGPSLAGSGVPNVLANPTLELRDGNGALIRANNNWQDDPAQAALITAAGLAPANPLESAIAEALAPGPYTVLLAGLNNGTGVGLVEIYDTGTP